MRLTLDLSHHAWTRGAAGPAAARTLEIARAADEAGINVIWVNEDPEGWDAFAILSAMATVTSRAALGTGVINPYARHPNLLAASVATLDRLSGGRAILGIGRGQVEWQRDALGIETGSPLTALAETVELLRAWWIPPYRASSGADGHFAVQDWERSVHPLRGSVPIYLAAAGARALDLAGRTCDGVMFNMFTSAEALSEAIPRVRDAATFAGRDAGALAFVLRTSIEVVNDQEAERKALDRAKTLLSLTAPLPGMGRLLRVSGFDVPAILEDVSAAMRTMDVLASGGGFPALKREGDLAAVRAAIPDDLMRKLGIIGPLPVVQDRLRTLATVGVTHVGVAPPHDATSLDAWRRLLGELREG